MIRGILPRRRAVVFAGSWSRYQDSRGEALFPIRADIRAVHDDPVLPGRRRSAKHAHGPSDPREGPGQGKLDTPAADVALRDVDSVHADSASGGDIDHGIVKKVLLQLDPGHSAAGAPVKTAHARFPPVSTVRSVLRRRDKIGRAHV